MINKHEIGDVIWYSFKNNIAFSLKELLIGLDREDINEVITYLN